MSYRVTVSFSCDHGWDAGEGCLRLVEDEHVNRGGLNVTSAASYIRHTTDWYISQDGKTTYCPQHRKEHDR